MSRHAWVCLVGALLLAACGGNDSDATPPPPVPSGPNHPPTLSGPTVSSAEVSSNTAVPVSLTVSDPDGDALTFTWSQSPLSPAGSFETVSRPNVIWSAPVVQQSTVFTLRVTVDDNRGGVVQGTTQVTVKP
jgi:Bacterial Ig domain